MAQLMQDKGEVIACDIHEHKLELIAKNAARLGMKSVKALQNDALQLRSEWLGAFDRVLVDAPCSGLGVLRRRAEARWRKQRKDLKLFPPLQLAILKNAAQYVKDGGTMVYSTCTIEPLSGRRVFNAASRMATCGIYASADGRTGTGAAASAAE